MRAIGVGAGLLAFLAAALSAEAQINIEGINPGCVVSTDTSTTYVATLTGSTSIYWKLCVSLNDVPRYTGSTNHISGPAPLFTVSETVTTIGGWGMQVGNSVKFTGKAGASSKFLTKTHERTVLVVAPPPPPPGSYLPRPDRRSSPAGVKDELYAAVPRDEEEMLA